MGNDRPRDTLAPMDSFDRGLLATGSVVAARHLIGAHLVRDEPGQARRVGRIVEVEAYLGPDDRASHARFGRTRRTATMFGPPGRAYVYRVYGMYTCLNVVTGPAGSASAVLIRGIAPLEGEAAFRAARLRHDLAAARRTRVSGGDPAAEAAVAARIARVPYHRLTSGPGLVGAAFGIDVTLDGADLCDPASPLRLEPAPSDQSEPVIATSARIGVAYAGEPWAEGPYRFFVPGDGSVSGPRSVAAPGPRR